MNPLGGMPASTSAQGTLNSTDFWKIFRALLVLLLGTFLTNVPKFMGMTYVWHGVDYTAYMQILITAAAEMVRRWLAGQPRN